MIPIESFRLGALDAPGSRIVTADPSKVRSRDSDARDHAPAGRATTARRRPPMLRALRHRNFRLFFSGQAISLWGTWAQFVAQSWLVYRLTGSAALLGLVGFANRIPIFVLAPIGGTFGDRYDRRRIVLATQVSAMVLAFVLAGLTLTDVVRVWHVVVLAALLGVVSAIDLPVRQAFIADMVGRDDIINAVSLNSSMVNAARIVGPAIAGVLVAAVGEGWCFFVNGASYLAVITALLLMTDAHRPRTPLVGSALANIKEGFRYVVRTRTVRALLLLLGLVSLMGMPYTILMPIFADRILHRGAGGLGMLMGVGGVGALAGALMLAMRDGIRGLGRLVALSAGCFGLCLALFSQSRSYPLSLAILVPVGFFMIVQIAASNTVIQTLVPNELRGRVMAVYSMMFVGMAPFGAILSGTLAEWIGAPYTLGIGGLACMAGAAAFAARIPSIRHEARAIIVAMETAGCEPAEGETGRGSVAAQ